MAPTPSPELPLTERLLTLAKTLQFAWFSGHLTLLLCFFSYFLSWMRMNFYTRMAQFCYRTSFIAAAATYGIVVYKTFKARAKTGQKAPGGVVGIITEENVQYLVMALVWLFMPQYIFAVVPYVIYSLFHVATYTRSNLIPTISGKMTLPPAGTPNAKPVPAPHPISEKIGTFVKNHYDTAMLLVARFEVATWFRVFLSAILFQRRSWILITIYSLFLRNRYAQSTHVQNAFSYVDARVNNILGSQNVPPAARQGWDSVKQAAQAFLDLTDIHKYMPSDTEKKAS